MKLRELSPEFLHVESETSYRRTDVIAEADGILFKCPKCFAANGDDGIGVHSVICWQPRVPQTIPPVPGRWDFLGSGYDDLTLKAGSSSILLSGGCGAHFFITNGEVN